jgi:hypothetical protein
MLLSDVLVERARPHALGERCAGFGLEVCGTVEQIHRQSL